MQDPGATGCPTAIGERRCGARRQSEDGESQDADDEVLADKAAFDDSCSLSDYDEETAELSNHEDGDLLNGKVVAASSNG